ncbi:MAG: hypothetical protein KAH12_10380, partial [Anaerolineales bacterium]|nr:hypothetical protein [Anaerolineales bacterium]
PEINSKNHNLKEMARRTALNTPIQGTAADLNKLAMVVIDQRLRECGFHSKMIMQVHDELVFEVLDAEVESLSFLVKSEMENVVELGVPLKVSMAVGESWYDAK